MQISDDAQPAVVVSCIATPYRPHPGDEVIWSVCVEARRRLSGWTVQITLPPGLEAGDTDAPDEAVPVLLMGGGSHTLLWRVQRAVEPGVYEYQARAVIPPMSENVTWTTRAQVSWPGEDGANRWCSQAVSINVAAQGQYLNYLPSLYQQDDLMGRFLLLFESMLSPVDRQVDHLHLYLDPLMTPSRFLPWLASWLGLTLDTCWSEAKWRKLIQSAISLYRKRGTRRGLTEYLEIVGARDIVIVEHRASNFRLGCDARLGQGIALGRNNQPHTFDVSLSLPPLSPDEVRIGFVPSREERIQAVRAIIEAEKPAHTRYTLHIQADSDGRTSER